MKTQDSNSRPNSKTIVKRNSHLRTGVVLQLVKTLPETGRMIWKRSFLHAFRGGTMTLADFDHSYLISITEIQCTSVALGHQFMDLYYSSHMKLIQIQLYVCVFPADMI